MSKMIVEIDMTNLAQYDAEGYRQNLDAILVDAAADALADRYNAKIEHAIAEKIESFVDERIRAVLEERITGLIALSLSTPFPVLDRYGRDTGETTSIGEKIEDMISKLIHEKVNYRGEPSNSRGDDERWERIMKNSLRDDVEKVLEQKIKAVGEEARSRAEKVIARLLAGLGES